MADVSTIGGEQTPYFGEPWPSGICDYGIQVPTPVGTPCLQCDLLIEDDDRGSFMYALSADRVSVRTPVHRECSLRMVLGGIGHLMNVWEWVRIHGVP